MDTPPSTADGIEDITAVNCPKNPNIIAIIAAVIVIIVIAKSEKFVNKHIHKQFQFIITLNNCFYLSSSTSPHHLTLFPALRVVSSIS